MSNSAATHNSHFELPRDLKGFFRYYWNYDPKSWMLFMFQDFIHFSRYQVAFIFVGLTIDALIGTNFDDGVPLNAWIFSLCIFVALGIGESMHIWMGYIMRRWKPALRAKVRKDFFNYALGHSHAYYQDNFAGSIARKVTEIAESSWRLHDVLRFNIFGSLTAMFSATLAMYIVSPIYSGILVLFLISVMAPILIRLKKISRRARNFSESRAEVTGTIVDIFGNIGSMRNFAQQGYEQEVHGDVSTTEQKNDGKRILTLIQLENYRRVTFAILGGGMMVSLLYGWGAGIVTVGQMSAIMGQSFALVGAVWMFSFGVVATADELGYIDDGIRILTKDHDVQDKQDAKLLDVKKATIAFKDVGFKYENTKVFDGLNLQIEAGQRVGLIGASGAGKSTLVSILLRLFDLQSGKILIDGQNIADVSQDSLRRSMSVIPQDTTLFHRSLADNIRYGLLSASDDEIRNAAKLANADEFISLMPDTYDTLVGERGIKLSGGQRQRIAIARAFIKDAPILILDEATSALDSESEHLIQDAFASLMEGKTVIAIAHRLSTIAHMDRLIVIDQGQIVEDGTHAQLIEKGGIYAKLWSMQSNGFLIEEKAA